MPFAPAVVERMMNVQEVLLKAISGQLTWLEAEDILGWPPRTLRFISRSICLPRTANHI